MEIARRIKWFWQRGRRGWSDKDVWSIDYYLAEILPPMLLRLKAAKHGIPGNYVESDSEEGIKLAIEKWNNALDTMIAGFKAAKSLQDSDYIDTTMVDGLPAISNLDWKDREKEIIGTFEKGMKVFQENFFNLWD